MSGPRSRVLAVDADPERLFYALHARDEWAFWLDPGAGATQGVSILGAARIGSRRLLASPQAVTVSRLTARGWVVEEESAEEPLDVLAREIVPQRAEAQALVPGWVGWIGYEAGARMMGTPHHRAATPDVAMLEVDRAIVVDHASGVVTAIVDPDAADADEWLDDIHERVGDLPALADPTPAPTAGHVGWHRSPDAYSGLIERCLSAIRDGEAYQLCLTNEVSVATTVDPFELFRILRREQQAPHSALLRFGPVALVSTSPERFLRVDSSGLVQTSPIKGTRPRGSHAAEDARLADELHTSEKERAENLMIVDLMRNDLARVAEPASVRVTSLFEVQSYPSVHQLVSTVEGQLPDGVGIVDAVRACFPPGSMTGAPKHRAMTLLDALEERPRGIYSGIFGWIGRDGTGDLAVAIRSVVIHPDAATIGTGGGITSGSDPRQELVETWVKAAPLLRALGAEAPATS